MTGPIDESRHGILWIGEDGMRTYIPTPYSELTWQEELSARDVAALERWVERVRRRHDPGS